jgi:hypothetical protein
MAIAASKFALYQGRTMSAAPTPEELLARQEAEVARLKRETEIAEAVLRGMRVMRPAPAAIRGPIEPRTGYAADPQVSVPKTPRRGRQPGAISHQWRDTLAMLYMNYPHGFTEYNAATAANAAGLPNVRPKDAADRMIAYVQLGYVEVPEDDENKFRVAEYAVNKYGFQKKGGPKTEDQGPPAP